MVPRPPTTVGDFTALPLVLPPAPSYPRPTTHTLYLRANDPPIPTENTPRELFLVNLPIDATTSHLRTLFASHLGGARVEAVDFEDAATTTRRGIKAPIPQPHISSRKRKRNTSDPSPDDPNTEELGALPPTQTRPLHRSGSTAVVCLVDRASAHLALKSALKAASPKTPPVPWDADAASEPPLGSARYAAHHTARYPPHTMLQTSVDAYMSAFSALETTRARNLARQRAEPDADGFVTVTRGGRGGPAREAEVAEQAEMLRERAREREARGDFYRFQTREKRKAEAKDLVKGFEEDRRRVEEMRRRRGRARPE